VDPYGGNSAIYEATFAELKELIDQLIQKLEKN